MMKYYLNILVFLLFRLLLNAQQSAIDSLKEIFQNELDAEKKYIAAKWIYTYYEEINRDSALYYAEQGEMIARNNHHKLAEAYCTVMKSYHLIGLGRFADALQGLLKSFAVAEEIRDENETSWDISAMNFNGDQRLLLLSLTHHMFGLLMIRTDNMEQQIIHFKEAGRIGKEINYAARYLLADMNLGRSYLAAGKPDSALYYEGRAEETASQSGFNKYTGNIYLNLGGIYNALGNRSQSLHYYYKGLQSAMEQENRSVLSRLYLWLTKYHLESGNRDSALYYAKKNMEIIRTLGMVADVETDLGIGYEHLYLSYKLNRQFDSAFKYQGLALVAKDSLSKNRIKNLAEFQNLTFSEQLRLQNVEKEKIAYQNKIRIYFLLAGIGILLLLAIIFYRNNRQKNKAKIKIEQAYDNLKATQQQLIQSEKMASLGELTAGIAHEIQNPLNFVNNFSDVNTELIYEAKQEIDKGNTNEVKTILDDIKENEQKINHHGKRADAIVKGMLQHSRSSSGKKESTDINALADEYLRLAYHGMRAKDKSFTATTKTDFDEAIGKINVIPQDIGRVILNLITNAFYAVTEKKKSKDLEGFQNLQGLNARLPDLPTRQAGGQAYEPTVTVSTKKKGNKIEVKVADNGNGIPQKVRDKIFQPFFTTKPTGQGTGLGLSLSYDIVKAHGGEIKVHSKEGEGTEFVILLNQN